MPAAFLPIRLRRRPSAGLSAFQALMLGAVCAPPGMPPEAAAQNVTVPFPSASTVRTFDRESASGGEPQKLVSAGSAVFFVTGTAAFGRELWKSDGTAEGTVLVKDLTPGPASSDITSLTAAGNTLYFVTGTGLLWKSDGTEAGTVPVHDAGALGHLTAVGDAVFFTALAAAGSLWRSDGTADGTVMVKDALSENSIMEPLSLTAAGGTLYFSGYTFPGGGAGRELWKCDGAGAAAVMVKDILPGERSGLGVGAEMISAGGLLYFLALSPETGWNLWRSDGTEAGTFMVADIDPAGRGGAPRSLTASGGMLFFTAETEAAGRELWRSDGTEAGTFMVKDIYPGRESALTSEGFPPEALPAVMDGCLYFSARAPRAGAELWRSDGTAAGTWMVKNLNPDHDGPAGARGSAISYLRAWGGRVYFWADTEDRGAEFWVTDGTAAGTAPVRGPARWPDEETSLRPGSYFVTSSVFYYASTGAYLLFPGYTAAGGRELWRTDGTAAGTVLVKRVMTASSGRPHSIRNLTASGDAVFFQTHTSGAGRELWKSGGTETTTVPVKSIPPDAGSVSHITPAGDGSVYFSGTFRGEWVPQTELWRTDGTAAGSTRLLTAPEEDSLVNPQFTPLGNLLLFAHSTRESGRELWRSDGTEAGTVMVTDLNPESSGLNPRMLTVFQNALYFGGDIRESSRLWKSDGTAAGTVPVKEFPGNGETRAGESMVALGDRLIFTAGNPVDGYRLWKSDGTPAGTAPVTGVQADPGGLLSFPAKLTLMKDRVYFWSRARLCASDGTAAGTVSVWTLPRGVVVFGEPPLTACGGILYFTIEDTRTGLHTLWKADGASAECSIVTGSGDDARILGQKDGVLYFSASDPEHGYELRRTDGTEAGTSVVEDTVPGPGSSLPAGFALTRAGAYYGVEDDGGGKPALRRLVWPAAVPSAEIFLLPEDAVRLTATGLPSRDHAVDISSDLRNWTPLAVITPSAAGTLEHVISPPAGPGRFLRVRDIAFQPNP